MFGVGQVRKELTQETVENYYSAAGSYSGLPRRRSRDGSAPRSGEESDIRKQAPYSPHSLLHPSVYDVSAPSSNSSPNNYGLFPTSASPALPSEMSGASSPKPERSPNPERSLINKPQPTSSTLVIDQGEHIHPPPTDAANPMQSNLGISHDERTGGNKHVMSWMSYEDGAAGPTTSCSR